MTIALSMRGINKAFNKVQVLKNTNFILKSGECHALMGGNGAGKSTLMKILDGVYSLDSGDIEINGKPVNINNPKDAEHHGVSMIFQEFSLIPTLTVAQNIFLGNETLKASSFLINDGNLKSRAKAILKEIGTSIDPEAYVSEISVGARQIVEIAKAISKNAKILIMDEPTASLSEDEVTQLFKLMARLKDKGISIVYISHRMSEIFRICDRVTVMRDGNDVLSCDTKQIDMKRLISEMLGTNTQASMTWRKRQIQDKKEAILEVDDLTLQGSVQGVSFKLYPGQIFGLAGLTGSGRTEIVEAVFGLRKATSGTILINGQKIRNISDAINAGAGFVPEDRRVSGLTVDHSYMENLLTPNLKKFSSFGIIRTLFSKTRSLQAKKHFGIKVSHADTLVRFLSGGNQQKIVLAKWLERQPELLILDEPTIGVDIGSKSELIAHIRAVADAGSAVLMVSSELEELLGTCDKLLVLSSGKLTNEISRIDIASEEELHHAIQQ